MISSSENIFHFDPVITDDTAPFWKGCKEHRLLYQKCKKCGSIHMPAAYLCPVCLEADQEWEESCGKGTVYSYVIFRKAFHPFLREAIPYIVAEVDLKEGFRLLTNILCDPKEVFCGMEVQVSFLDRQSGATIPCFLPLN